MIAPKVWTGKDGDDIIIDVQKAIEEAHKAKGSKNSVAPKAFVFEHGKALTPEQMKQFELHMKSLGDHIKVLSPGSGLKMAPMTEQERKAFEESMKGLHESMKLMPKSIEGMKLSEKERKELETEMKKLHEEMKALPGEMKMFKFDAKDLKELKGMSEAERKAFEKSMKDLQIELKDLHSLPKSGIAPVTLKSASMKELMKSLTPDQKAKHERQGYLKLSDLSGAQKKMLGNPSGNFTISVNMDGQKLTIKNP
jgi:tRNA nucleotidyltransferase/poly(A) polymerase